MEKNIMKGKLPVTEMLVLETNKEDWQTLSGQSINYQTTALIERFKGINVRVKLLIRQIYSPNDVRHIAMVRSHSPFNEIVPRGEERLIEFFHNNIMNKNLWILVGLIDGKNRVPIIIYYYENLGIYIYTQKLENENEKDWLQIASQN